MDSWSARFDYQADELVPQGADAQYTSAAYDVNSPTKVALRRERREAIDEWSRQLAFEPEE